MGTKLQFLYEQFEMAAEYLKGYPDEMDIRKNIVTPDPLLIIESNPKAFQEFLGKTPAEILKKNIKNPAFMKIMNEFIVSLSSAGSKSN